MVNGLTSFNLVIMFQLEYYKWFFHLGNFKFEQLISMLNVFCHTQSGNIFSLCFLSRIAVVAKSFEGKTDLKEEWYGTDYKLEKIPESILQVGIQLVTVGFLQ